MQLVFRVTIGCVMVAVSVAIRMSSMSGPMYVMEGTNVTLECEFDLEGDELYSLLWWRGGSVLLRYTALQGEPHDSGDEGDVGEEEQVLFDPISNVTTRPVSWFPAEGLNAHMGPDGGPEALLLVDVGHEASGVYTCEVTAESPPTFLTANTSVNVTVVVPPSASPLLQGTAGYVTEGQRVAASCDSAPALPPPTLAFYINDRPVPSELMTPVLVRKAANSKVVVSRSVGFTAHGALFIKGHLALECRVTIDQLVWKATNDLVLQDYRAENRASRVRVGSPSWLKGAGVALLFLYYWLG